MKLLHIRVATLLETSLRTHFILLAVLVVVVLKMVILKIVMSGATLSIVASHHLIILALIVIELVSVSSAHMTTTTVIVEVAITTAHVITSSTTPSVITATEAATKSWLLEPTTAPSTPLTVVSTSAAFTLAHVALVMIVLRTPLRVTLLEVLLWCLHRLIGNVYLVLAEQEQLNLLFDSGSGLFELSLKVLI